MKELIIKLKGEIQNSNFDKWKSELIKQIKSANKELKTDKDFIQAEETIKSLKQAEKALEDAKQSALNQSVDIQKLFSAIDEISAETRTARLGNERQVKVRKEEIKQELVNEYFAKCEDVYGHHIDTNSDFKLVRPKIEPFTEREFKDVLKNKRTIKSMRDALETISGVVKENIAYIVDQIEQNRIIIDNILPQNKSLFQDARDLLSMSSEMLQMEIEKRLAVHEAEQLKQREAQNEQPQEQLEEKPKTLTLINTQDNIPALPSDDNYTLSVFINASADKAKSIANKVNDAIGSEDGVVRIRLQISNRAA